MKLWNLRKTVRWLLSITFQTNNLHTAIVHIFGNDVFVWKTKKPFGISYMQSTDHRQSIEVRVSPKQECPRLSWRKSWGHYLCTRIFCPLEPLCQKGSNRFEPFGALCASVGDKICKDKSRNTQCISDVQFGFDFCNRCNFFRGRKWALVDLHRKLGVVVLEGVALEAGQIHCFL